MTNQHKNKGEVRTDLHCHSCEKDFIALLDYDINNNHVIVCPHCSHEHCRVIKDGVITGERWDSRNDDKKPTVPRRVWKSGLLQMKTSTVSSFMRERWLNRDDVNL